LRSAFSRAARASSRPELVSGVGALLGGGADGLDFCFGGGRVGEGVNTVPQPGTEGGDAVGLGAQRPQ